MASVEALTMKLVQAINADHRLQDTDLEVAPFHNPNNFFISIMATKPTTHVRTRAWTPVANYLPSSMRSATARNLKMGQQPSSAEHLVGGNQSMTREKPKLRDIEALMNEPSQAEKDRSALISTTASPFRPASETRRHSSAFPASRLSMLNPSNVQKPYQVSSPSHENGPSVKRSDSLIKTLLAGYAETISDDSEPEDVPYEEPAVNSYPIVAFDTLAASTGKGKARARLTDWSSDASEDPNDDDYRPSTNETNERESDQAKRDAYNARCREKYWTDKQREMLGLRRGVSIPQQAPKHKLDKWEGLERPSKVVKLSVSPKGKVIGQLPQTVVENASVTPEFPKGKRSIKRDGLSQTREFDPSNTQSSRSDNDTANAVDYRARIAYQKELEQQLREMIDQDIVQQVEAEGWITPAGRLFKAGVRMMERGKQERQAVAMMDERVKRLDVERQSRRIVALEKENEKMHGALEQMRQVMDKLDLGRE